MNGHAWNAYINNEYNAKFEGLDETDKRRDAIYDAIMEEYEEMIANNEVPAESVHESASTRINAAKKQFTGLVSLFMVTNSCEIALTLFGHLGSNLPQLQ